MSAEDKQETILYSDDTCQLTRKAGPGGSSQTYFRGGMFELVLDPKPNGIVYSVARRAPGVRIIIADMAKQQILLTKEFRRELDDWDYRLPGGKVFDSVGEYITFCNSGGDILKTASAKAIDESAEETGIDIESVEWFATDTLGTTVEWDLMVFVASSWQHHADGQRLGHGEQIIATDENWFSFAEAIKLIEGGLMQEHRIALVLLMWLRQSTAA